MDIKRIAIVADEDKRASLIEWSYFNKDILCQHEIIANEQTAELLRGTLNMPIAGLLTGMADGYRELSALIENNEIDVLIFFGTTIKAENPISGTFDLLSLIGNEHIVVASNRATADVVIESLRNELPPENNVETAEVVFAD